MYDRILVPTDGSDIIDAAVDTAFDIAAHHDAAVHFLYVADSNRPNLEADESDVRDSLLERGEQVVGDAAARARERDVESITVVREGDPASGIVEYADEAGIDLVVIPTHGRTGVSRLFLGSITERVVRESETPVLVVRPESTVHFPFRRVLVPTDGSDVAQSALETGIEVAREYGATLELLHVVDTASLGPEIGSYVDIDRLEERAEDHLADDVETAKAAGLTDVEHAVEYGTPNEEIEEYVTVNDIDLVVMGTHGLTGLDRYLLGSTTEKALRTAPAPVLTVHGPDED